MLLVVENSREENLRVIAHKLGMPLSIIVNTCGYTILEHIANL
tara:strand:- start:823 stop:951 length:129 start_codon:yes stop_codon:yes gene_type:complete